VLERTCRTDGPRSVDGGPSRHFAVVRQWVALGAKRKPPSMHRAISLGARPSSLLSRPERPLASVGQNTPSRPRLFRAVKSGSKNIRIYRISEFLYKRSIPAQGEGRSIVVTTVGWVAVDAGSVGADVECRAGQWIEPNPVSARKPCRTNGADCVRQNRVVLAVVATVKLSRRCSKSNRASCIVNLRGDGDKREFVAGESAHKPSNHCAGKAGCSRLPCGFPVVLCVCIFSHSGPWVPAGARSSLRPLHRRG
jgi:hypothetical protein